MQNRKELTSQLSKYVHQTPLPPIACVQGSRGILAEVVQNHISKSCATCPNFQIEIEDKQGIQIFDILQLCSVSLPVRPSGDRCVAATATGHITEGERKEATAAAADSDANGHYTGARGRRSRFAPSFSPLSCFPHSV